jgi:hypothetical protein
MIYFELYRNCTGSYIAEMEQDIRSTMRVVDCRTDDGDLAKAHPSLSPLIPSGLSFELVMRGFPKMGCLRISTWLVGSDLTRPGLTLI